MDARWKLVAVLFALVMLPWLSTLLSASLMLLIGFCLLLSARIELSWCISRLLTVGVFLLLFVVVLPFSVGPPYWTWGSFSLSERGLQLAFTILLKGLAAVCWTLFLTGTSTIEQLLHAATTLGVPQPILRVLLVTWRYVQVMYRTIEDFRIALRLRGFRNRVQWQTYVAMSNVIGTLFVHGFDHTERVVHAMRARGYHGRIVSLEETRTTGRDLLFFLLLIISTMICLLISLYL